MAPQLTREVARALANGQFVNFGSGGEGGTSAAASGAADVMSVVQTLMAAKVLPDTAPAVQTPAGNGVALISAIQRGTVKAFVPDWKYDLMALAGGIVLSYLTIRFHPAVFGTAPVA